MKTILTTLAAVALTIGTAYAADFPIRDVEDACQAFSTSQYPKHRCIDDSQASYDITKRNWSLITKEEQSDCIESADKLNDKHVYYRYLETCVDTQIRSAYLLGRYKRNFQY